MNNSTSKSASSLLIGLILILVGIGFLLQIFNIWNFGTIIGTWWPLLVIAIGLASLLNAGHSKTFPLIIIIVGVLLQLQELDMIAFSIWNLWPLILIGIGLSLLLPKTTKPQSSEITNENLDEFTIFGGIDRKIKHDNFKGGDINVLFGGTKIDLRESTIAPNAHLNIFTAFGGVEIFVPENCEVKSSGTPIMGGWEDKSQHTDQPTSTLIITGTVIFGGIEIKN